MDSDETMARISCAYQFFYVVMNFFCVSVEEGDWWNTAFQKWIECKLYDDEKHWKIFGKLTSQKGKGSKIERKVGCGTWKIQRIDLIIDSKNNHVGFREHIVFEVKGSSSNEIGHW